MLLIGAGIEPQITAWVDETSWRQTQADMRQRSWRWCCQVVGGLGGIPLFCSALLPSDQFHECPADRDVSLSAHFLVPVADVGVAVVVEDQWVVAQFAGVADP